MEEDQAKSKGGREEGDWDVQDNMINRLRRYTENLEARVVEVEICLSWRKQICCFLNKKIHRLTYKRTICEMIFF